MKVLVTLIYLASFMYADAQSVSEIIRGNQAAMGGLANWAHVHSIELAGKATMGEVKMGFTLTIVNDSGIRMESHADAFPGRLLSISTPSGYWALQPDQRFSKVNIPGPHPRSEFDVKTSNILDSQNIANCVRLPDDSVGDFPCFRLLVTDTQHVKTTYFISKSDFHILKVKGEIADDGTGTEYSREYSNFKMLPEGIAYPFRAMVGNAIIDYTTVEINRPAERGILDHSNAAAD